MDADLLALLGPDAGSVLGSLEIETLRDFAWRPAVDLIAAGWPGPVNTLLEARATALLEDRLALTASDAADVLKSYDVESAAFLRTAPGDVAAAALVRDLQRDYPQNYALEVLVDESQQSTLASVGFSDLFSVALSSQRGRQGMAPEVQDLVSRLQPFAALIATRGADAELTKALLLSGAAVDAFNDTEILCKITDDLRRGAALPRNYDFLPLGQPLIPPGLRPESPVWDAASLGGRAPNHSLRGTAEAGAVINLAAEWTPAGDPNPVSLELGSVIADENGSFSIDLLDLPDGHYRIRARAALPGEPLQSLFSTAAEFDVELSPVTAGTTPGNGATSVSQLPNVAVFLNQPIAELLAGGGAQLVSQRFGAVPADVLAAQVNSITLHPQLVLPPLETMNVVARRNLDGQRSPLPHILGSFQTGMDTPFVVEGLEWPADASVIDALEGLTLPLTIRGRNFHSGMRVDAGRLAIWSQRLLDSQTIECQVVPRWPGLHDVVIADASHAERWAGPISIGMPETMMLLNRRRPPQNGLPLLQYLFLPDELDGTDPHLGFARENAAVVEWMIEFPIEAGFPAIWNQPVAGPSRLLTFEFPAAVAEQMDLAMLAGVTWNPVLNYRAGAAGHRQDLKKHPVPLAPERPAAAIDPPVAFTPGRVRKRGKPKKTRRCCHINFVDYPDPVCVGQPFSLQVSICADAGTLLTVDHPTGGFGTLNGGWSSRSGNNASVSMYAASPGVVSVEVKLWCKDGPSDSVTVHIRIRDCDSPPPDPPGGGGLPVPGGGAGGGGGGAGAAAGGTVIICTPDPGDGQIVSYGDLLRGKLAGPGDHAMFSFGGHAGDFVTVRSIEGPLSPLQEVKVHFTLYDDHDQFVAAGILVIDPSGLAERVIEAARLPRDGSYKLIVCLDTTRSRNSEGKFLLELEQIETQPIQQSNNARLTKLGDVKLYTFFGQKNTFIDLDISGGNPPSGWGTLLPDFSPYFQVVSPAGKALIAPETIRQRVAYQALRLTENGEYVVRVAVVHGLPGKTTGVFSLNFRDSVVESLNVAAVGAQPQGGPVEFGGHFGSPFQVSLFSFDRAELDRWYVDVMLTGTAGVPLSFTPRMQLIDPEGDILLEDRSDFRKTDVSLQRDGLHHLRVFIQLNDQGTGDQTSGAGNFSGVLGVPSRAHVASLPPHVAPAGPGPGGRTAAAGAAASGGGGAGVGGATPAGGGVRQPAGSMLRACLDPVIAVLGAQQQEAANAYFLGDVIVARAVPILLLKPPANIAAAWSWDPPANEQFAWLLTAEHVDGHKTVHPVPAGLAAIGLELVELDKNILKMRVVSTPEILCLDIQVQCFEPDPSTTITDGPSPAVSTSNTVATDTSATTVERMPSFPADKFDQYAPPVVAKAPCRSFSIWPPRDQLGLFDLKPGMLELAPRSVTFADGLHGVLVHNGSFVEQTGEYHFENCGLPVVLGRKFYSMLRYDSSIMGAGWVFEFDIRLIRVPSLDVHILNPMAWAREARYKLDPARSNQYVKVVEKTGTPGSPVLLTYDALIDTFYTPAELSEVIAVTRFSPPDTLPPSVTSPITTGGSAAAEESATATGTGTPAMTTERVPVPGTTSSPGGTPQDHSCETFYILRYKDGAKYRFNCHGRLEWIHDRHRNEIRFEYVSPPQPFAPTAMVQSSGSLRHVIGYETHAGFPRITSVTSPDQKVYQFQYDDQHGWLAKVISPLGVDRNDFEHTAELSYGYTPDSNLETITSPRHNEVLKNKYQDSRITDQWIGGHPASFDFGSKKATDRVKVEYQYEMDAASGGLLVSSRSILTEKDPPDPRGPRSAPTPHRRSWTYDADFQVLSDTDPDGREHHHEYDPANTSVVIGPESQHHLLQQSGARQSVKGAVERSGCDRDRNQLGV